MYSVLCFSFLELICSYCNLTCFCNSQGCENCTKETTASSGSLEQRSAPLCFYRRLSLCIVRTYQLEWVFLIFFFFFLCEVLWKVIFYLGETQDAWHRISLNSMQTWIKTPGITENSETYQEIMNQSPEKIVWTKGESR